MEIIIQIINAVIGLIILIIFIVMAFNISKIKAYLKSINSYATYKLRDTDKFEIKTCQKCKNTFYINMQEEYSLKCPHCGYLN